MFLTYDISLEGLILGIEGPWDEFATTNGVPGLTRTAVEGRSIWSFIQDVETRYVLQGVVDRCRKTDREFRFPFRCDAPERRRFMELQLDPREEGIVRMTSKVLLEEFRTPARLLERARLTRGEPIRMCSWCKRIPLPGGEWVEVETAVERLGFFESAVLPPISHGICPDCLALLEAEEPAPQGLRACA